MSSRSVTHPALFGLWVVAILGMPGAQAAQPAAPDFSIDIAADCNRYIENAAQPGMGNSFLQEGIIYRPGTLAAHCPDGNGCGVNRDGTPEFPTAVIGKWRCWGSFVEGTAGGPPLYSTQVYELTYDNRDTAPGEHALVSHGPEWGNSDAPFQRVIAGGYGRFMRSSSPASASTKLSTRTTPSPSSCGPRRAPGTTEQHSHGHSHGLRRSAGAGRPPPLAMVRYSMSRGSTAPGEVWGYTTPN